MRRSTRFAVRLSLFSLNTCVLSDEAVRSGEQQVALTVQGKSSKPITFTAEALAKLDRAKLEIGDDQETYEGVPLANVLHAAGVTWGTKCSLWLDCYVTVDAADEYRAVFSIPEIDPGLAHKLVLLADRRNGKPFKKADGPYQLIEEGAKQRGRWVKQVTAVSIRMAAE
jgi:hypothetical protein